MEEYDNKENESQEPIYHECRAAGIVWHTSWEWMQWLKENEYDTKKPMAQHGRFKWNVMDECVNPHVFAEYQYEDKQGYGYRVLTARTQYGWLWGYALQVGKMSHSEQVCYPSRYDPEPSYYETEKLAARHALDYIIGQLEYRAKNKGVKLTLLAAKNARMDIVHPQQELFKGRKEGAA